MTSATVNVSRFARYFWLALAMFFILAATFTVYVWTEKLIDRANELRQQSLLLAEELRQSSDDLTRMARAYVATGDPSYKRHFQEIIDIRDGRRPRPLDYGSGYWDLVQQDDGRPRPYDSAVPLLELMRQARFADVEFGKLAEAKANSDRLVRTELAAMALAESDSGGEQRARAIAMLHDAAYHHAKAGVMRPISEFRTMVDRRTAAAVRDSETNANRMRAAFVVLGLMLVWLLLSMKHKLDAILGASVGDLHARIARLGRGELQEPIPVPAGSEGSVLGWLAETQSKLARIEAQRSAAEARSKRMADLYAALSHCNQAIVRCPDQQALFEEICRAVVLHGGMTMAWIGLVDQQRTEVRAAASFGSGTEYLNQLRIALDPDAPSSRGPTGHAYRQDAAYWCQDFMRDPNTLPWREQGERYGWAASAAIPLHLGGKIIGFLNAYSTAADPFDEEVRTLFLEMAADIEFALRNFEREAQRAQAEAALRDSEHRLRTIFDTEPECVKLVDREGRLVEMNRAGLEMLELESLEEAQQAKLLDFLLPEYRDPFIDLHKRVMRGESGTLEFKLRGALGTVRVLKTHAAPLRDAGGSVDLLLGITRDVTARRQADERIQYLAHFDALTGLPNREQLNDLAKYALSLAQRSHEPVALMFLDLDNFKDINDSLGHTVGDALLMELSQRLRRVVREQDTVARMGGDEFIFLMFGVDAQGAGQVAEKVLNAIGGPYRIERHELNVSGSIGIALYPDDGAGLETLFQRAEAAMYRVKQEGRHGYRFFTAEMQAHSARHLQLVNGLRQALERGQLHIHYQPQVSLQDGVIIGAEALLRWTHPELGAVSPAEFIPAAEGSGLILPIGAWVLRHAVRQAQAWRRAGLPLVMAVNLSAVQFRNSDLPNQVTSILEEEGLPPKYLELELTEGVAMHDPQGAIAVMNDLHARGVRMSIDDFGTGYSSLSHLKKFKVYKLKIDQSFVRDIGTDPEDRAIVGAIIHMAQSLGLHTIAEGVETEDQLAFLREQGCREMQGYYFSRPLPADRFETFWREKTFART